MLGNRLNVLEIATAVRDGVAQHWAAHTDPSVEPLPDRRLLHAGDAALVPWDCEQLVVATQGVGNGQSDDTAATAPQIGAGVSVFNMRHAIFEVLLLRCVSVVDDEGNAPPDVAMEAEGMRFLRDVGMLSQALTEIASRVQRGLLEPGGIARAGSILGVGPDGGFAGVVGVLQVTSMGLV